uniref:ANK_REP_REGION domain-containing protein n=1 Tax=Macrostomum lignano TaxID=282301 RepID=A0A1I8GSM3_9PLAT
MANQPGGGSVLLQFLSANSDSNPKRRMETAVLDEDADAMRDLVTSGRLGVNDEITSQSALTALHLAARSDRAGSVRALIELGANPTVRNFLGQSPLDCSVSARAPRAMLELARRAPILWRDVLRAFIDSMTRERAMDSYVSFTMHLLVGLMQPVGHTDPAVACRCLVSYTSLVKETTVWAEEHIEPPLRPTRALFPDEHEREPIVNRYVAESPFLLDSLMRPEAFFSALLGVYNYSGVQAALIGRGASQSQLAAAESAVNELRRTINSSRCSVAINSPQSLRFACRNAVRRALLATEVNYVHSVYQYLPLDFATRAFLVYQREIACVMESRPRTRYTGL